MRSGLTGEQVAQAMLWAGDISPRRLQKAAQHLQTRESQEAFFATLAAMDLSADLRAQIKNGIAVYLPVQTPVIVSPDAGEDRGWGSA